MKPEDWANLQVGAWAALHWVCSGSARDRWGPGPLAHSRLLTLTHARTRTCTFTHSGARGGAHSHGSFPTLEELTQAHSTQQAPFMLVPRSPGGMCQLAHSHSLRTHSRSCLPTNNHTHTCSAIHINHPSHIHTNPFTVCYPHSHTCSLLMQTRNHTHIRLVHTLVLLHTSSHIYSPR